MHRADANHYRGGVTLRPAELPELGRELTFEETRDGSRVFQLTGEPGTAPAYLTSFEKPVIRSDQTRWG